jgi:hypothetical protein
MELVGELVAGSTVALAQWIAALNHEPVDHAMEDDAVVVRLLLFWFVRGRSIPGAFGKPTKLATVFGASLSKSES